MMLFAIKKEVSSDKEEKKSLVLCDSPNNMNEQMERREIAQTLLQTANVLPGTRIGSQVMYQ